MKQNILLMLLIGIFACLLFIAYNIYRVKSDDKTLSLTIPKDVFSALSSSKDDLRKMARKAAYEGSLANLRAAIAMDYAERASNGLTGYPPKLTGKMFSDGVVPDNPLVSGTPKNKVNSGQGWIYAPATGTIEGNPAP